MKFQSMMTLQKRFCLIDSPIPFQLVCNPMGTYNLKDENGDFIGDRTDIDGTDICSRPAGAWLFDTWKLLPEKYMKENPAFKMAICYDESLLSVDQEVKVSYSDVNLGEGVAGVNGQDVQDLITHNLLNDIYSSVSDEILFDIVFGGNKFVAPTGANEVLSPIFDILKLSNNHKVDLYIALTNSSFDGSFIFDGTFSTYYTTLSSKEIIRFLPKKANLKFDYHTDSTVHNYDNRLIGLNLIKDLSNNFILEAQLEPLTLQGQNIGVSLVGTSQKYNNYVGNRITIYK